MRPTETLATDHALIEDMLEVTRTAARDLAQAGDVGLDLEALAQAVDFFREFADQCQFTEDEQGRRHVRSMAEALGRIKDDRERTGELDRGAVDELVNHALSYADLLSNHLRETELAEACEQAEVDETSRDLQDKYHPMVHDLLDRLTRR